MVKPYSYHGEALKGAPSHSLCRAAAASQTALHFGGRRPLEELPPNAVLLKRLQFFATRLGTFV